MLAENVHARAGGPALYVGVYFNPQFVLTKRDLQPLSRSIAAAVLRAPLPQAMSDPVELGWGHRPEQTQGIQIHPSVDGRDRLWHPDAGGWVAPIGAEHIANVLNSRHEWLPWLARGAMSFGS